MLGRLHKNITFEFIGNVVFDILSEATSVDRSERARTANKDCEQWYEMAELLKLELSGNSRRVIRHCTTV